MKEFGICMAGLESSIEEMCLHVCRHFEDPCYVEIGTAYGTTLAAVATILRDHSTKWKAVGIDIPEGWSLHIPSVEKNAANNGLAIEVLNPVLSVVDPKQNILTLSIMDSHKLLSEYWNHPIHLALIDGCHGKPCVTGDFLNLEKFVPKNGIVMFHDFGDDSVGESQPHCGVSSGDSVGAARDLGLLDNSRPGWTHVRTVVGDKAKIGRDLGIFMRV